MNVNEMFEKVECSNIILLAQLFKALNFKSIIYVTY